MNTLNGMNYSLMLEALGTTTGVDGEDDES